MSSTGEPLDSVVIPADATPVAAADPFEVFASELGCGAEWYLAALRAAREWRTESETLRGRRVSYLVGGEALDLLLVIERLAAEQRSRIDRHELRGLIFGGEPPMFVPEATFATALGPVRYKAYLNFFYGVTVEEALLSAAELEVSKSHALDALGSRDPYERIYAASRDELLVAFGEQRGSPVRERLAWPDAKEFTYWLFRYRLRTQPPPRMASDTKKALDLLRELRGLAPGASPDPLRPDASDGFTEPEALGSPFVVDVEPRIGASGRG